MGYKYTNRNKLHILGISFFILLATPIFTFASVTITEIMYDPKDTDASAGGEWIEVQNTDSLATDLTKWIFFENDTNHGITADGALEIPPGGYAVISRDLIAFKNYFTGFSGLLFKASFSLNDGEKLAMKSSKEAPVTDANSVTYTSEWGAKNDGNSLQKDSSGKWIATLPTPGVGALENSQNNNTTATSTSTVAASGTTSANNSSWPVEAQIFANAGPDKVVTVGGDSVFEGKALGIEKKPIDNARFIWNFGDGTTKEGKSVLHSYKYPGEYIVILDVSSGYFSASDRVMVRAEKSKIIISSVGDGKNNFIELSNPSNYETDISEWIFRSGTTTFILPARTFIGGNKKLIFASDITRINPQKRERVELLYPNGSLATFYQSSEPPKSLNQEVNLNSNRVVTPAVTESTVKSEDINLDQTASAIGPTIAQNSVLPSYKWIFGVMAVALVSIIGVSLIPKVKNENVLRASDFKIIEEE